MIGQAKPRVMFLEGDDPLTPGLESLALEVAPVEEEDPGEMFTYSNSQLSFSY